MTELDKITLMYSPRLGVSKHRRCCCDGSGWVFFSCGTSWRCPCNRKKTTDAEAIHTGAKP